MESEDFPFEILSSSQIGKDLSKVQFDWENFTDFNETNGFANYPVGYKELKQDFHVFFVNAGGDWEFPICFIFYWGEDMLRAYIPARGNAWNKIEKCAYGSEEEEDPHNSDHDDEINESEIIEDILDRIIKKEI